MKRGRALCGLLLVLVGLLSVTPMISAANLNLRPAAYGELTQAFWRDGEGLPDAMGDASQALYFEKMPGASPFAAGVAVVSGLEGANVSALTHLAWERREVGHCDGGAPRWSLAIEGLSGTPYSVYFACATAEHSPGSDSEWLLDSFSQDSITTAVRRVGGTDTLAGMIRGLAIVFNEGPDVGVGFVYLDNITVNDQVWTSEMDNNR